MLLRELFVKLGLDVDEAAFAKGALAAGLLTAGVMKLAEVALESAGHFVEMVKGTAEAGHEIEKTSQIIGVGTDQLQKLRFAARMTGVEASDLDRAVRLLSRTMVKSGHGNADVYETLAKLADKFKEMPDGAKKTAMAMKELGRGGAYVIPLLNLGAEGIRELSAEAYVMNEEELKASKDLVVAQKQLAVVTENLWKQAIVPLLPAVTRLVQRFTQWKKANAEWIKLGIRKVIGSVVAAIDTLTTAIGHLQEIAVPALLLLIGYFVATQAAAIAAAVAAAAAWVAAAAPLIAAGAAVILLLLVLDDINHFLQGKGSAMGDIIDKIFGKGTSKEALLWLRDMWVQVKEAIHEAYEQVAKFVDKMSWMLQYAPQVLLYKGWRGIARAATGGAGPTGTTGGLGGGEAGPMQMPGGFYPQADARRRGPLGGGPLLHQEFNITQQPSENGEHFAKRVAEIGRTEREEWMTDWGAETSN